jgi:MFS family permease
LLGLTFAPTAGWTSSFVAGCFVIALVGLPIFVWIELRAKKPLIEMTMFKHKVLAAAVAAAVLCNITHYPVGFCAPLYLQNVLGASAVITGLVLAVLPLSTALASWISGRLADRLDVALIACVGLLLIFGGIVQYSGLETDRNLVYIIGALAVVGTGLGIFTPSNQKVAFASVQQKDYAVLAAVLSSFGTAAGTIGTTTAVALMELRGGQSLWVDPVVFASAQQFAFSCLAPIGLLAVLIAYLSGAADSH